MLSEEDVMSLFDAFKKINETLAKVQAPSPAPRTQEQKSSSPPRSTLHVIVVGLPPDASRNRLIVKAINLKDGTVAAVCKDQPVFSMDTASFPSVLMGTYLDFSSNAVYQGSAVARTGGELQLNMKNIPTLGRRN
jgi:hypothetical protein